MSLALGIGARHRRSAALSDAVKGAPRVAAAGAGSHRVAVHTLAVLLGAPCAPMLADGVRRELRPTGGLRMDRRAHIRRSIDYFLWSVADSRDPDRSGS